MPTEFRDIILKLAATVVDFPKPSAAGYLQALVEDLQSQIWLRNSIWQNRGNNHIIISNEVHRIMEREFTLGRIQKYSIKCDAQNNGPDTPISVDIDYTFSKNETVAIQLTPDTDKCFTTIKDDEMGLTEVKSEVF